MVISLDLWSNVIGFNDVHLPKMNRNVTEFAISTKAQELLARIALDQPADDF